MGNQPVAIWKVYCHTNKINNKKYIGITSQKVEDRWGDGKGYTRCNPNSKFSRAIKKYGWDEFKHEVLHSDLNERDAKALEMELISKYDSLKNGYNMTVGGEGCVGYRHRPEDKLKFSGENHPMYGKKGKDSPRYGAKNTDEHNRRISEANAGRKFSEEHKQKLGEGKKGKPSHNKGKTTSIETREKQRMAKLGGKSPTARKVICGGIEYECIKDCAEANSISAKAMGAYLTGLQPMSKRFQDAGLMYLD